MNLSPTAKGSLRLLRQTLTAPKMTHPLRDTVEKLGLEADAPHEASQKAVKSGTFLCVLATLGELCHLWQDSYRSFI